MRFLACRAFVSVLILFPTVVSAQSELPKTSDWNRIHALSSGVVTRVRIHKHAAQGERDVKGFFSSATDTSITLLFRSGQTGTIDRRAVSAVRVRRPFKRRYAGWVIAVSVAGMTGYLYNRPGSEDLSPEARILFPALITAPSALAGFLMMPTRLVYRAPRNP